MIGRPNFPDPGLKPADGIEIRASNVTIDLNGFSLSGGSGALRSPEKPSPSAIQASAAAARASAGATAS